MSQLVITPLVGVPEIGEGDSLSDLILVAAETSGVTLISGDVVTVTSKVVSKAEGRVVPYDGSDEGKVALILQESRRVLRRRGTLHIV